MGAFKCCKLNFLQWRTNWKYPVCGIFLLVITWNTLHGFSDYAEALGCPMRPWLLALLPGDPHRFVLPMLAYLMLISDAPFRNRQQQFVLQRVGKRTWIWGQILYLFFTSVLFAVLLWVLSWVFLLPNLEWQARWGPAIQTAAQTGNHMQYAYVVMSYNIIQDATPIVATAWVFFMLIAVNFLFGLIVTVCNLWAGRGLGTAIAVFFCLEPMIIELFGSTIGFERFLLWMSPVSWLNRSYLQHTNQNLPSVGYAIAMTLGISILLILVIVGTIHRCNLDANKE